MRIWKEPGCGAGCCENEYYIKAFSIDYVVRVYPYSGRWISDPISNWKPSCQEVTKLELLVVTGHSPEHWVSEAQNKISI